MQGEDQVKCFGARWVDVVASSLEEVAGVEEISNKGCNLDMGHETSKIMPSIDTWADESVCVLGLELKITTVMKLISEQRIQVLVLQEMKVYIPEEEVRKVWVEDKFEFRVTVADGRPRGLLTVWEKKTTHAHFILVIHC
ncbi:hypothetical protein V6N12_001566 [Hibiscus sabdariffa]|uniref:Uncharacterized protein n=1 Tax=Hibiscus sabdariffa TaxID=183260 RepID=A0ABR1ZTV7_9ROSI